MEENTVMILSLDGSINLKAKVKFSQEQQGNWAYKLYTNEADAPVLCLAKMNFPVHANHLVVLLKHTLRQ